LLIRQGKLHKVKAKVKAEEEEEEDHEVPLAFNHQRVRESE